MPLTPIEQLQLAGFSEGEIGGWAQEQRQTLGAAGFGDDEIDGWLGGKPPNPAPTGFLARLARGLGEGARQQMTVGAGPPGTTALGPDATADFLKGARRGWGDQPLGIDGDKDVMEWLRDSGLMAPGGGGGTLQQTLNEMVARGLPAALDVVLRRAPGALIHGFAEMAPTVGVPLGALTEAFPVGHLTGFPTLPPGGPPKVPIGRLPERGDLLDAARVTAGPEAPADAVAGVHGKIERLWDEHGVHPAEVIAAAERDPTIVQDLLSADDGLPRAIVGARDQGSGIWDQAVTGESPQPVPLPPVGEGGAATAPAIRAFRPGELRVDAARFQFKEGGDSQGVTTRLTGVEQWDPIKAGLGLAWEDPDGATWIVDGHQRRGLAERIGAADPAQDPRLNAWVLRAADGVAEADARAIAAAKNIAEGTGTAVDAAKVLRDRPDLLPTLPPRSELVRQATALLPLDAEAFGKVVNELVPANYAAIVGRLAPDDPKLQNALIDLLHKTQPDNVVQAESVVRAGLDAGIHRETQASLFGDQEVVSSLYGERARILDLALKQLRRDRIVFQGIVDNRAIIEELGNRLAQDENVRRAAIDGRAAELLQILANRRGALGDALTGAARGVADGSLTTAAAARDFVAEIRRQAASGDLARIADGGSRGAVEAARPGDAGAADAGGTGPGGTGGGGSAGAGRETGRRDVAPAEEARASQAVDEAIRPPEVYKTGETVVKTGDPVDVSPKVVSEQTAQGEQLVIPGAERSARQAAEAREAEGHGRAATDVPQQEPGGLFEAPEPPPQPGLFERLMREEEGALRLGPEPPRLTPAEAAIADTIAFDAKREGFSLSRFWHRFYTAMVDRLHPIEQAVNAAADEALPAAQNPYKLARLLSGAAGKAEHWLNHGQVDFATYKTTGPSLKEILRSVEGDLERFDIFATSVRALELEARGIETGKNTAAARRVAADGLDRYGPTLARLIQFQDSLARYLRDAGVLSADGYTAMRDANRLYVPFYRAFDEQPPGSISAGGSIQPQNPIHRIKGSERETVPALESIVMNAFHYVQMAERNAAATKLVDLLRAAGDEHGRVRDVSREHPRDARAAPAFREPVEGGGAAAADAPRPRPDLFPERGPIPTEEAPVRRVDTTTEPGLAEAVKNLLAEYGLSDDLFDFVANAAPPREGEIRIFRDGKPENWQVGKDVAASVKALDNESVNVLIRLMAPFARGLRAGATLTPDFMLRNIVRDFVSAFIQTSQAVFHPVDSAKGLYSAVMKDEHYQNWLKGGGGNATLVALDRRYLQESLRDLNASTGLMERGWNVVRHPVDALRTLSELSEQTTRLGEFRGIYDRAISEGMTPKEAMQEAGFASREVTLDFARRGAVTQSMNMITAFWNAQVQGMDRIARAFRDDPVKTGLKVAAGVTAPSVFLWWVNHDDPDYWELPSWQRDLYWIVPVGSAEPSPLHVAQAEARGEAPRPSAKFFMRVPKPFETGVLFGSGVERTLSQFFTENPAALEGFGKSMIEVLTPSIMPTVGLPILEQFGNRSTFTDRNLIPQQLEKLLPEYQYQPYTTETAKKLGQIVAAFPGLRDLSLGEDPGSGLARTVTSPILIENYLRGWTGGLGMYALQIADAGLRKSGVLPDPPKPEDTLADIPVVRAFIARHPSGGAESIQRFYDDYEKNKRYFDSWMAKARDGDEAALGRIEEAGGIRLFVQLDGIKEVLADHAKLIRDIWKDPEMPAQEKRQLIDQLYFSQIEIAQSGRATMREVDRALAAP